MQIKIENISKSYYSNNGLEKKIFKDFSFSLDKPDFVTIIGPNGSGKSTLFNLLSGIDTPDKGRIVIENDSNIQGNIGYVWQDYRSSLLPWLNVYQNIEFPLKIQGIDKPKREKIVDDLLKDFKISFSPKSEVYNLSGGQQQLICLLRSIASNPTLLLCDEPFSALDQSSRWTMAFYLEKLWLKKNIPILFISHDIDESILLGSKIMLINRFGKIEDILENKLPRPRNIEMFTSSEHNILRQKVIQFMKENGAIQD